MPFSRKTFVSLLILFSLSLCAIALPARTAASNAPNAISVIDLTPISGTIASAFFLPDGRVLSRATSSAFSDYYAHSWIYENNALRTLTLGGDDCWATHFGNQVIGKADIPGGASRAFIYTGGEMRDLGTLPGRTHSGAQHVNDAGHVVGTAYNIDQSNQWEIDYRAFYYNGSTMLDLGTMPGAANSIATGIDNSGRILGVSFNINANGYWVDNHAFLYTGGVMIDLTPGGSSSYARAEFLPDGRILSRADGGSMDYGRSYIYENNALSQISLGSPTFVLTFFANNQLYGGANLANGVRHAYRYQSGVTHDLGVLPGKSHSHSVKANAAGHVAGYSYNLGPVFGGGEGPVEQRAFYHNGTTMIDIGALPGFSKSNALSIDEADRVLGYSFNTDSNEITTAAKAFLYDGGTMIDLTPINYRQAWATFLPGGRILSQSSASSLGVFNSHAWVYENNTLHELTLGSTVTVAFESNGQVVGWAQLPGGARRGIYYAGNGVVRDVGTLPGRTESSALSANAAGHVAGESYNFNSNLQRIDLRAFYHNGTAIQEINPVAGTEFNTVTEIDNQNRILGISYNIDQTNGGLTNKHAYLALTGPTQQGRNHRFDFDGDGKTDTTVFRPSNGYWYVIQSQNNSFTAQQFGASGDRIVPEDYDGDGKTDLAVFRPSNGYWYITDSQSGAFRFQHFGATGDIPAPGDYDGDGKSDLAVFRPSAGTFYILNSSDGSFRFQAWGTSGDVPLTGDYDGDGKTDLAVFRESAGAFYILQSSDNSFVSRQWGALGDKPVAGDFDGDGKADAAVFRPSAGAWYVLRSSDNGITGIGWGASGDVPVAGEYDGDGKWDISVFRPSSGVWYILKSTNNGLRAEQFGLSGDAPAPAAFVP